jgi:hypothetical protein
MSADAQADVWADTAVADRPETQAEHHIEIALSHYTENFARYRVTYQGEVIKSARDPEFVACRALLARGIRGALLTRTLGSSVPTGLRIDIEKGAGLTTIESEKVGPKLGRYAPHPKSNGTATEE